MRVLVIEDDARISTFLRKGLEASGYGVVVWENGEDGFLDARVNTYDLIVLDLLLPGMDGFEIARELRCAGKTVPILMLTARTAEEDTIRGLDSGADDYLTKPFRLGEFLARVRALLRRDSSVRSSQITVDDLVVDTVARRAFRSGHEIPLSAREYALLEFLGYHAGQIVPRQRIEDAVWGDIGGQSNVVDVYVGYLRHKIDTPFPGRPLLHTARGIGYALRTD